VEKRKKTCSNRKPQHLLYENNSNRCFLQALQVDELRSEDECVFSILLLRNALNLKPTKQPIRCYIGEDAANSHQAVGFVGAEFDSCMHFAKRIDRKSNWRVNTQGAIELLKSERRWPSMQKVLKSAGKKKACDGSTKKRKRGKKKTLIAVVEDMASRCYFDNVHVLDSKGPALYVHITGTLQALMYLSEKGISSAADDNAQPKASYSPQLNISQSNGGMSFSALQSVKILHIADFKFWRFLPGIEEAMRDNSIDDFD